MCRNNESCGITICGVCCKNVKNLDGLVCSNRKLKNHNKCNNIDKFLYKRYK